MLFVTARVQDCDHRADRKTPLGNIFYMESESKRDKVCDEHYSLFVDLISNNDPATMNELRIIKEKASLSNKSIFKIGCHCAPKRCHVDTIVYFLNNYLGSI